MVQTHGNSWRVKAGLAAALAAIIVSIAVGCAIGRYGRLYRDAEVTQMFRVNSVPDYYNYYINGRSNMPYAIIGIDPRYRIEGAIWEPVAPNTDEFADKVAFVWRPDIWEQWDPAEGAWIEAPDGEKIGIWFSMYPYTTVKMEDGNRVAIFSPSNLSHD